MITLLMMCFPIVEDLQGFIRLGDPITVSQEYTHGQVLTALKFTTPSDSYICTINPIDNQVLNRPEKLTVPRGGWVGWAAGYGYTKK